MIDEREERRWDRDERQFNCNKMAVRPMPYVPLGVSSCPSARSRRYRERLPVQMD